MGCRSIIQGSEDYRNSEDHESKELVKSLPRIVDKFCGCARPRVVWMTSGEVRAVLDD